MVMESSAPLPDLFIRTSCQTCCQMSEPAPAIKHGSRVSLHFSLALENGEVIDSNFHSNPASFRIGDGNMLPGFEAVLVGLCAGDKVETLLQPDAAFGAVNPKNRHQFPIAKFSNLLEDELLPTGVGSVVAFKDAAGFDLPGVISAINNDNIIVDFNHPLAGKAIWFKAAIIAVVAPDVETIELRL